uniref:Zinc-ribbon domain-containing protein n=1 Tax=candidate division WOR-3 bacterium TaxID=2052148 RepID=A0A7C6A8L4_UNCW3
MPKAQKPKKCRCPFCDGPLLPDSSFCQTCKVEIIFCRKCGAPIPKNANKCPKCGNKR